MWSTFQNIIALFCIPIFSSPNLMIGFHSFLNMLHLFFLFWIRMEINETTLWYWNEIMSWIKTSCSCKHHVSRYRFFFILFCIFAFCLCFYICLQTTYVFNWYRSHIWWTQQIMNFSHWCTLCVLQASSRKDDSLNDWPILGK